MMTSKIKFLNVLTILFLVSSCANNKTNEIFNHEIKVEVSSSVSSPVALSEISDFSILPLPTSEDFLINEIRKIHSNSDFVYLSDGASVYKISYDGSLVGQINKRGTAPDEYLGIDDFQIDNEGNILILSRNMKALLLYSWDNKLLKKIDIGMWGMSLCLLGDKALVYTGNEETLSDKQLHLLDLSTGVVENSYKKIDENRTGYLHVRGNNVFRSLKDKSCLFTELFNDTVYRITENLCSIEHTFDWDGHNVPSSFYEKKYANIMEFFQRFHQVGTYAYGINLYTETATSYWVSYFYKQNSYLAIVPKSGAKEMVCDKLILDTSFGQYPIELINVEMFVQDSGCIIIPLEVYKLKEYMSSSSKDIMGRDWNTIADDSNPYLLIVSPKK